MEQAAQCHLKQVRDCQIPRVTMEDRNILRQARQPHHVRDNRRSVLETQLLANLFQSCNAIKKRQIRIWFFMLGTREKHVSSTMMTMMFLSYLK